MPGWSAGTVHRRAAGESHAGMGRQRLLRDALRHVSSPSSSPWASANRVVLGCIIVSFLCSAGSQASCPFTRELSEGMRILVLTIVISAAAAVLFPQKEDNHRRRSRRRGGARRMKTYLYILVMAATTYLIRVLPLTLIRKPIQQRVPALVPLLCALRHACGDDLPRHHERHTVAHRGRGGHGHRHRRRLVRAGASPRVARLLRDSADLRAFYRVSKSCKTPSADFPRRVFLCIHSTFSSPTEKKYSTFSLTFLPITRIRAMEYASS